MRFCNGTTIRHSFILIAQACQAAPIFIQMRGGLKDTRFDGAAVSSRVMFAR
jgi:hypothetical protein